MIRSFSILAIFTTLLVACTQVLPGRPVPRFDFLSRPTVPVLVSDINVVNQYQAPFAAPNVDHLFNVTLSEAVQHWVDRRFSPQGQEGTLEVVIEDASVIEEPLQRTQGIQEIFTLDQSYRYKANLVVSVRATDPATGNVVSTRVTADHSRTISEYASIQDRDEVWIALTQDIMRDLDLYLTKSIREKLPFLIR